MRTGERGRSAGRCGWWLWLAGLVLVAGPFACWGASEGGLAAVSAAGQAGAPPWQMLFGLVLGEASEAELRARIRGVRRTGTDPYTGGPVYEAAGEDLPEPGFSRAEFVFGAGRLVAVRLYYRTGVFGRRFREIVCRLSQLYELQHKQDPVVGIRFAILRSKEEGRLDTGDEWSLPVPKVRVRVSEGLLSFEGKVFYETPRPPSPREVVERERWRLERQRAIERMIREGGIGRVQPSPSR